MFVCANGSQSCVARPHLTLFEVMHWAASLFYSSHWNSLHSWAHAAVPALCSHLKCCGGGALAAVNLLTVPPPDLSGPAAPARNTPCFVCRNLRSLQCILCLKDCSI
jgi:hypothetical protein